MPFRRAAFILTAIALSLLPSASHVYAGTSSENLLYIYSGGRKIGYSYDSVKTEGGVTEAVEKARIRVRLLDNTEDVETEAHYRLGGDKLLSFEFRFESPSGKVTASGVREGDSMRMKMKTLSGDSEIVFDAPPGLIPVSMLPSRIISLSPEIGREYRVPVIDPVSVIGSSSPGDFESSSLIAGRDTVEVPSLGAVSAWRVESTIAGARTTSWIADGGKVLKELIPPGMTALRDESGSMSGDGLSALDVQGSTSIPSDVTIDDPRGLRYMKAEIGGIGPGDGFDLSDGYRQSYDGKFVTIRAGDISRLNTYALPNGDPALALYLAPENLIQSGDKEIISKSREILEGEKDSLKAAIKLNTWVFTHLKKTGTAGIPNARDVLKTGSGDCNEHSALFAALARAAGIPTKTVSGTIYLDGRFYYHAWNEVFVGEWVAVDPTFGQVPADATHIKLVEGDLTKSSLILNAAGKINLKILDAS